MAVAVLSSEGQITIPADIRNKLGLRGGDKVVIDERGDDIVIQSSVHPNVIAMMELQEAFAGEAERVGWTCEEDVVKYCKQIRREMWEERREHLG